MFDEQVKYTAGLVAQQKEEIIRNAIYHRIRDNGKIEDYLLDLSDLMKRGSWKLLPDRTEIFSFDGVELVQFFPMESEIKTKDSKITLTITRSYELLYG